MLPGQSSKCTEKVNGFAAQRLVCITSPQSTGVSKGGFDQFITFPGFLMMCGVRGALCGTLAKCHRPLVVALLEQ